MSHVATWPGGAGGTGAGVPRIEWLGPAPRTAADLLHAGRRSGLAVPRAVAFLEQHLAAGWCDRETLVAKAAQAGISFRTLERAKAQIGVLSEQRREEGRNVWYWKLGGV